MRGFNVPNGQIRYIPSITGVPDDQAWALDRRHRLETQQRSFRGLLRGIAAESSLASEPFAVTAEAGRGPA